MVEEIIYFFEIGRSASRRCCHCINLRKQLSSNNKVELREHDIIWKRTLSNEDFSSLFTTCTERLSQEDNSNNKKKHHMRKEGRSNWILWNWTRIRKPSTHEARQIYNNPSFVRTLKRAVAPKAIQLLMPQDVHLCNTVYSKQLRVAIE